MDPRTSGKGKKFSRSKKFTVPAVPATPDTPSIPDELSSSEEETDTESSALKIAMAMTATGVAGRVALQGFPSIEPITALAVASGYYFGLKEGVYTGATAFFLSNFMVYGGQGPWTFFQVAGAAAAGATGYMFSKTYRNRITYFGALIAGVMIYELAVNLGSVIYTPWAIGGLVPYFLAAVPFALIHAVSTLGFGGVLHGFESSLERFN